MTDVMERPKTNNDHVTISRILGCDKSEIAYFEARIGKIVVSPATNIQDAQLSVSFLTPYAALELAQLIEHRWAGWQRDFTPLFLTNLATALQSAPTISPAETVRSLPVFPRAALQS